MGTIFLKKGDICQQQTEAIVNAANNELFHGGGVAGAIIKAGGSIIQKESNRIAPIPLGEAAVTSAGKLKANYVIHAASMRLGEAASEENVRNSIINSFKRAEELDVKTIAFPAIGAGVARFPLDKCAKISLEVAGEYIKKFEKIIFVLYNDEAFKAFESTYKKLIQH